LILISTIPASGKVAKPLEPGEGGKIARPGNHFLEGAIICLVKDFLALIVLYLEKNLALLLLLV
jgi:hypothetical protein